MVVIRYCHLKSKVRVKDPYPPFMSINWGGGGNKKNFRVNFKIKNN